MPGNRTNSAAGTYLSSMSSPFSRLMRSISASRRLMSSCSTCNKAQDDMTRAVLNVYWCRYQHISGQHYIHVSASQARVCVL